jgi:hypothetical protein
MLRPHGPRHPPAQARRPSREAAAGSKSRHKPYKRDTYPKILDLEVSRGIFISPLKNHRKNKQNRDRKAAACPLYVTA